jgi:hypothetical protein
MLHTVKGGGECWFLNKKNQKKKSFFCLGSEFGGLAVEQTVAPAGLHAVAPDRFTYPLPYSVHSTKQRAIEAAHEYDEIL